MKSKASFCLSALIFLSALSTLRAQVWSGNGNDDNWSSSANWSDGVPLSWFFSRVQFPFEANRRSPVVDKQAPWILNRLDFYGNYSFSGNALSFQGTSPQLNGGSSPSEGPCLFANDIEIPGQTLTIDGTGGVPLILTGNIKGAGGLTTHVPLILSGASTVTGPIILDTQISSYAITVTNAAALGPAGSAPVEIRTGQLALSGGISVTGKSLSLGTGLGYTQGLVNASGDNSWAGPINLFTHSYLTSSVPGQTLTISGPINGQNQADLDLRGDGDFVISGAIANIKQALTKGGAGTLTLSGVNTSSALINILKGTVVLQGGNAIADNGRIALQPYGTDIPVLRLEADETIGALFASAPSIVDLKEHTLRVNQNYNFYFEGTITGTGRIVKAGDATLELYTPNNHTGGTVIERGALQIHQDSCLAATSSVVSINGGILQSPMTSPLTLDAGRSISLDGTGAAVNAIDSNSQIFWIPGQISGAGSLTKVGSGTLRLSSPFNNYQAGTKIMSGILQFDSLAAIAGSGPNVVIGASGIVTTGFPLEQSFLSRIDPSSDGILALVEDSATDLDFGAAGLINVFFGSLGSHVYSGTLSSVGGTLHLGGTTSVLEFTKADALSHVGSVGVGLPYVPLGRVVLSNSNTLTGDVTVGGGTLEIVGTTLNARTIHIGPSSALQLDGATLGAALVTVDATGSLLGCGTLEGDLTNNGLVQIHCPSALRITGTVINNGTISVLGGAALVVEQDITNYGLLDLLTSPATTLPPGFINYGTVVFPGDVKIRNLTKSVFFTLQIQSFPGHTYQLQKKSSLSSDTWQYVTSASSQTGADLFLRDYGATAPQAFYRIQVSP